MHWNPYSGIPGRKSPWFISARHIVFGLFNKISSIKNDVGLDEEFSEKELMFIFLFQSNKSKKIIYVSIF